MKTLKLLAATVLFAAFGAAEIPDLCNTGETPRTLSGCSHVLVTPNPTGGGHNRDGSWAIAYPYPSALAPIVGPCQLSYIRAWVDTPLLQAPSDSWLPNSASTASEWITPFDGEGNQSQGWFIYRAGFHVPLFLTGGVVPKGLIINGRLASDNQTYAFALASPVHGGSCALVEGLPVPINQAGQYSEWTSFSFASPIAIVPDSDLFLYVLVYNDASNGSPNATGLRIEFSGDSTFY